MRISKWCAAIGALAVGVGIALHAADNPAQAAARAALMKALGESPTPSSTPSTPPSASPAPAPASLNVSGDNPAQAAARAALMEKLAELNAVTPATNAAGAATANHSPAVPTRSDSWFTPVPPPSGERSTPAPIVHTAPRQRGCFSLFTPVPPPSHPSVSLTSSAPVLPTSGPSVTTAAASSKPIIAPPAVAPMISTIETNWPGKNLGFKPIEPPPPPVTPEQEAQLHALLQQYLANQITPEQYQAERAKILGEH